MVSRKVIREYICKCNLILEWAKSQPNFDCGFIQNVKSFMQDNKNLSHKQKNAIDNIINKFEIGFIDSPEPKGSIKDYDDLFNVPLLDEEEQENEEPFGGCGNYVESDDEFGLIPVFENDETCMDDYSCVF